MPSKRGPKPGPRWDPANRVWRVHVNGKRYGLGRVDETEAHVRWAKLRRELELDGPDAGDAPLTVAEATERWHALRPGKWHREMLAPWIRYAGAELVADLDADHLERFRQHLVETGYVRRRRVGVQKNGEPVYRDERREYSAQAMRHFVGHAHRVLQWCARRGLIEQTPDKPSLPKCVRRRRDYQVDELRDAFGKLNEAQARIARFLIETGCRPKEAIELQWSDVDLERGVCEKTKHKTGDRTGAVRRIRLTPEARAILEKTPRGRRRGHVFRNSYGRPWAHAGLRTALRRAGLNSVYRLRHTRAQDLLRQGMAIELVARWLGHKDLRTVLTYADAEDAALGRAAQGLASPLRPKPGRKPGSARRARGADGRRKADRGTRGRSGKRREAS